MTIHSNAGPDAGRVGTGMRPAVAAVALAVGLALAGCDRGDGSGTRTDGAVTTTPAAPAVPAAPAASGGAAAPSNSGSSSTATGETSGSGGK